MLTLKTTVAAGVLAGAVLVTAGTTYFATRATMRASVAVNCPVPAMENSQAKPDLPRGEAVPLKGYKSW